MKATKKRICKAIKEKYGFDVGLYRENGVFSFYSDDENTGLILAGLYSTTVYTYRLGDLNLQQWLDAFDDILNERNKY